MQMTEVWPPSSPPDSYRPADTGDQLRNNLQPHSVLPRSATVTQHRSPAGLPMGEPSAQVCLQGPHDQGLRALGSIGRRGQLSTGHLPGRPSTRAQPAQPADLRGPVPRPAKFGGEAQGSRCMDSAVRRGCDEPRELWVPRLTCHAATRPQCWRDSHGHSTDPGEVVTDQRGAHTQCDLCRDRPQHRGTLCPRCACL